MHPILFIALFVAVLPAHSAPAEWSQILREGWSTPTEYPIPGYSENTPPYFQGVRAYETYLESPKSLINNEAFFEFVGKAKDLSYYRLSVYEELKHLQPGLQHLANHWLNDLAQLAAGETPGGARLVGIPAGVIKGNPYWSTEFVTKQPQTIVSLTPLSLSRVQESLGRLHPWTVYGGSEQDWETVFWQHTLPKNSTAWMCFLLNQAYGVEADRNCNLDKLGVRILTTSTDLLPDAIKKLALKEELEDASVQKIKYLFTFRPAIGDSATKKAWPKALLTAYAAQKFEAIPHPATLIFSEVPAFAAMAKSVSNKEPLQIPLSMAFSQYTTSLNELSFYGLRALDVSRRNSRFTPPNKKAAARAIGSCDAAETEQYQEIFEAVPSLMGLYSKPIAHLIQMWGVSGPLAGRFLLDGPTASRADIEIAAKTIHQDDGQSRVHHRNYYPVMQINSFDVRWYRPLVAWRKPGEKGATLDFSLQGSVHFSRAEKKYWMKAMLTDRGAEKSLASFEEAAGEEPETTAMNVRKLQEFQRLLGEKLPEDLATALLNPVLDEAPYSVWKKSLPPAIKAAVAEVVAEGTRSAALVPLTFKTTVNSEFEKRYWDELVILSEGAFIHKNNCDCAATSDDANGLDKHCEKNHLPNVGRYLKNYYKNLGLSVYSQKFKWKVDFDIPWWEGLKAPQENIIVVIHGSDGTPHDEAVVLADHYDTAYMGDVYEGEDYSKNTKTPASTGHRHASKGADDNLSGTVTLMEAAKALRNLPLKRDVWLVHITGEEFPADGLGTRNFAQALVENQSLVPGRKNPKFVGIYQLDMIGHSTEKVSLKLGQNPKPAIFQIAPGRGERAAGLAKIAHEVTRDWNHRQQVEKWDEKYARTSAWKRYKIPPGVKAEDFPKPQLGKFILFRGEIRPGWHFRSSLYNTDAQQLSDTGIPTVLFMENYDIGRQGYHDTLDNIENIDLDFARGMSAIAIESVAQAATR